MNIIQTTKNKINNIFLNPTVNSFVGAATMGALIMTDSITYAGNAESMMSAALGYVCKIFAFIGLFFAAISFVQLMLALKREDAEAQSTQIRNMIIGLILLSSGTILNVLVSKMGLGVSVDTSVSL
jgi:hypothetical protein